MRINRLNSLALLLVVPLLLPVRLYAHPGRTDSSGGHTCRTNCASWGLYSGEYHYHDGGGSTYTPLVVAEPKIEYKNEIKTEEVRFEIRNEDDLTLEEGKTSVKQEGKNGTKSITYKVTYTDGLETAREKINEEITVKPIEKIILKGTKKIEVKSDNISSDASDENAFYGLLLFFGLSYGIYLLVKKIKKTKNES